jgi:hypothetical protein
MVWLTWRQYRLHVAVVYSALLAFAAALLLTGPHLADVYNRDASSFLDWVSAQRSDRNLYTIGSAAGYVVPALIGAFWGAPMIARELEAGTYRLVWTQGITRDRWLAAKLGLGLLAAAAATAVMSLGLSWWAHPIDKAVNAAGDSDRGSIFEVARISPEVFATRGLVPIGYAAFAFALGVLAGAILRRTVPAMAVTLAAYVLLQIFMPGLVRTHLVPPAETKAAITDDTLHGIRGRGPGHIDSLDVEVAKRGAWVLSSKTVDASGKAVRSFPAWVATCLPPPGAGPGGFAAEQKTCFDRLASEGYRQQLSYHPASHYRALQWRETGVLLGGAALLVAGSFWRVRRLS